MASSMCQTCGKPVYIAEEIRLDGKSYHKACFACQNCSRKLTLQTYFVDPHTSHTGIVFCKKCGPVHAPKVDVEAAEFKRMQKLKGGRLINDQVRQGVSKQAKSHQQLRKASVRRAAKQTASPRRPALDDGDCDGDCDGGGGGGGDDDDDDSDDDDDDSDESCDEEWVDGPEADVDETVETDVTSPAPGAQPIGYHDSGYPIYGNLAGTYAGAGDGAKGAAADSSLQTTGMKYSEEEVYDNPTEALKRNSQASPQREVWSTDQATMGEATSNSPQKKAELHAASEHYREAVEELERVTLSPKPFGDRLAVDDDHDAPHPDALSDPDYGQKCLTCKSCPGFLPHRWRKVCKNCREPRFRHASREVTARRAKQAARPPGAAESKADYAWCPAGLSLADAKAYFAAIPDECVPKVGTDGEIWRQIQLQIQLPPHDTDASKCSGLSPEETEAHKRLDTLRLTSAFDVGEAMRCPDFSRPESCPECGLREDGTHWAYCSRFIEPDPVARMKAAGIKTSKKTMKRTKASPRKTVALTPEEFYAQAPTRSIKSMKKRMPEPGAASPAPAPAAAVEGDGTERVPSGATCHGCQGVLFIGDMVVASGRFKQDEEVYFHPSCFSCSICGELLVDLRAHVDVGREERGRQYSEKRLFCGRHWAENRVSRCAGCDEVILQKQHVFEMGKAYHIRHFACTFCDANLTQMDSFVPRGRKPYCFPCFGTNFADICVACNKPINPTPGHGGKVTIGKQHWHGGCFQCKVCQEPLDGKPCIPRPDGVYCKPCMKKILKKKK